MNNYTNIALPNDLVAKIDEIIKKSNFGYRSRGEFAKEAVRMLLRTIK
ncbi:ribbon-helix-helix domain-containing protein [Candidatus Woesearchaeota archaeon]|nr:ribbon-helix-helix domain-containing protein [Candidatus Woesearchaeota archaeon]